jgi:hypothetical protein
MFFLRPITFLSRALSLHHRRKVPQDQREDQSE